MTITLLFFGATADIVGSRSKKVETAGENASKLVENVVTEHPELRRHKLLFALNEQYVPADTPVNDGDRLAIFTPVSGG